MHPCGYTVPTGGARLDAVAVDDRDLDSFDWDEGNLEKNLTHGVTDDEIEEVFYNSPYAQPLGRQRGEERRRALGRTDAGRLLAVVYTLRGGRIRPISARPMMDDERRRFRAEEARHGRRV